jgi:NAD-dependent deacetylase
MEQVLEACRAARGKPIVVLTGAGVSAESGIPTFRGKEGYWTIGSREYHPQELATRAAFSQMPWASWAWYLYRLAACRAAAPNPAHLALARLPCTLVTQNVDGLHHRAGSTDALCIHGDISFMRCAAECSPARYPVPDIAVAKGDALSELDRARLVCARCGGMARPHVLWFEESYDEPRYRFETMLARSAEAALFVIAGTSAQTTGPWRAVQQAREAGATIIDVNPDADPFSGLADHWVKDSAARAIPKIVEALL